MAPVPERPLLDLHRHLYGSLSAAWWLRHIAGQPVDPSPYEAAWFRQYDQPSPLRHFLHRQRLGDPDAAEEFRSIFEFHPQRGTGFERFQLHHDLLTWTSALADPQLLRRPTQRLADELPLVVEHAAQQCRDEGLEMAELRMMLPAGMRPAVARWAWGLFSHCCRQASTAQCRIEGVASLSRARAQEEWQQLAQCLLAGEADAIVAVDFSHREERGRVQDLQAACESIHTFNASQPQHAMAILVHVGESYERMSLESALRRVHQVLTLLRPHRIGHAVAAGISPDHHGVHTRTESVRERLDHLAWEQDIGSTLAAQGLAHDPAKIAHEIEQLQARDPHQRLQQHYDQAALQEWSRMQTWLRQELQRQQQIIEVCPTSTLRIAGVNATRQHHLHAFLDDALTVVIGSDDPGLFATTLPQECALASHWRGQDLHHLAQQWTAASRQLSGRTGS